MAFTSKDLQGFADAAHSLKLYRRADLRDDVSDKSLIGKLYVDPLLHDGVLETMLRESTTFLIGRKGTGKSTVFQRAQHALRTRPNSISAYVDIKTVYEAADVDPAIPVQLAQAGLALSEDELRRVLLYRSFIRAVLNDIKSELKQQVGSNLFDKILSSVGYKKSDITASLDDLLEGSFEAQITDVTAMRTVASKLSRESAGTRRDGVEAAGGVSVGDQGGKLDSTLKAIQETTSATTKIDAEEYSSILLRTFDIGGIIERLRVILVGIGVKRLYVFIDDFSELPEEAMRIFVDTILAPLNNWSNELVKFKVAAYPGRIYLGK